MSEDDLLDNPCRTHPCRCPVAPQLPVCCAGHPQVQLDCSSLLVPDLDPITRQQLIIPVVRCSVSTHLCAVSGYPHQQHSVQQLLLGQSSFCRLSLQPLGCLSADPDAQLPASNQRALYSAGCRVIPNILPCQSCQLPCVSLVFRKCHRVFLDVCFVCCFEVLNPLLMCFLSIRRNTYTTTQSFWCPHSSAGNKWMNTLV